MSTTWNVSEDIDTYDVNVTVDSGSDVIESDETNNIYSATFASTTDPPTSVIVYPGDGFKFNYYSVKDGLVINGTANDTDGWINKVEVGINGTWNDSEGKENWNYTWIPPEDNGNYTICSKATDNNDFVQTVPYCIGVEISGVEVCGNCKDDDGDGVPDWADNKCSQFFRGAGCGEVHYCNPADDDDDCDGDAGGVPGNEQDCGICNIPNPQEIADNSTITCNYYGYSTAEWHFYKIIPDVTGKLSVSFKDSGIASGPTDLSFYDSSCVRLDYLVDASGEPARVYDVIAGRTYIIALDVDAHENDCDNCTCGYWPAGYNDCGDKTGTYNLTTNLVCWIEDELDAGRDGWKVKVYNSTNCSGPSNWETMGYNDSSWINITLPTPCKDTCTDCDFYFRKKINISGTPLSVKYKFNSDDGIWLWVNGNYVTHHGADCNKGGCAGGGGGCCNGAENDVWRDITSYFNAGDNIVAVHLSEHLGNEYLDMLFNITYNSCGT